MIELTLNYLTKLTESRNKIDKLREDLSLLRGYPPTKNNQSNHNNNNNNNNNNVEDFKEEISPSHSHLHSQEHVSQTSKNKNINHKDKENNKNKEKENKKTILNSSPPQTQNSQISEKK